MNLITASPGPYFKPKSLNFECDPAFKVLQEADFRRRIQLSEVGVPFSGGRKTGPHGGYIKHGQGRASCCRSCKTGWREDCADRPACYYKCDKHGSI